MTINTGLRGLMWDYDEEGNTVLTDLGAEDCDRQYMLGDALLVAPVFREDGTVDYYLPEGTWTHLLSGETVQSPSRWYHGKYDFFSLPLYVRENTILPMGACDSETVYDYAKDVTLRIYNLADGATAQRVICDSQGNTVLTASAARQGSEIVLTLTGETDGVKVEQIGTDCTISVR